MKRFFLASVTLLSLTCFSQEQPKATIVQPIIIQFYQGYIIQVVAVAGERFGYDILHMGKTIVGQRLNPFNQSPKGLANREDALKLAQWQIRQLTAGVPQSALTDQPLPSAVARQLNIILD